MPEIIIVAHNIRSCFNVGSIFRTAESFGVKKIIFSGYTPYPDLSIVGKVDHRLPHIREKLTKQITKTSLGTEKNVDFDHFDKFSSAEKWLKANSLPMVALEQSTHSQDIRTFDFPKKFALILGEEVSGINQIIIKKCQSIIEIPMFGKKESLNVSIACAIALYQTTVSSV